VRIDAPLIIAGRTGKSWGSNMVLGNPGQRKIDDHIADVDSHYRYAPLKNFLPSNHLTEGVLTAKHLMPEEFEPYELNQRSYLERTFWDLHDRRALGVDVSRDFADLLAYADKCPSLVRDLPLRATPNRLRRTIGNLGLRRARAFLRDRMRARTFLRDRMRTRRDARKLRSGQSGHMQIFGHDFGFSNILEAADFLSGVLKAREVSRKP
jgi:hypothetical protein